MNPVFAAGAALCLTACADPGQSPLARSRQEPDMTSPRLAEAAELSGRWILSDRLGTRCRAVLLDREAPLEAGSLAAPMMALEIEAGCADLDGVRGWRPIPMGFELTDAAGFALLVFEQSGPDDYSAARLGLTMRRDRD